jgi:hypothetical protein
VDISMSLMALVQKPPDIIFLDQPFNWLPTVVSALQFVLLVCLTLYTFCAGIRTKISERRAAWYHKVVVDPMIPLICAFFAEAEKILCEASALLITNRAANQEGIGKDVALKITDFKKLLYDLSRNLQYRLLAFSSEYEDRVSRLLETVENDMTEWFAKQAACEPHAQRDDLVKLLRCSQTHLFRTLIEIEFETWGGPQSWMRRVRKLGQRHDNR